MNVFTRVRESALALLLLLCPGLAMAQLAPVGAPVTSAGFSAGARATDTAFDGNHGVFLVASAEHNTGKIWGAFLGTDGSATTAGFRIDSSGSFPNRPAVAYSAEADVFLVVWVTETQGLRGRLVRYGSNALGAADFLVGASPRNGSAPAVAYSATSEEFLVSWAVSGPNSPNRVVRVSTAGALIGSAVQVTADAVWTQDPALAWNAANNEFLLVFARETTSWQVIGQRISQGQPVGSAFGVQTSGSTKLPDVAYSTSSGKYLVSWFQYSPYGIYGKLLNADGSAAGVAQPLLPSTYGTYDANSLTYNSFEHKFGAASVTSHNSQDTIGGSTISSVGAVSSAARWVDAPAGTGNRRYPEIAGSTSSDRFVVSFVKSLANVQSQKLEPGVGAPPPPPPPPPPGSVSLTGLNPSPAPPVVAGTSITWTGVASGGTIEYQFWVYNGNAVTWTMSRDWSTSATYVQLPSAAGQYAVQVWARLQGQTGYVTRSSGFFTVTSGSAPPSGSVTLTGLTSNPAVPEPANTTITWTGAATASGSATPEYQFWLYSGASKAWSVARPWATSNTWAWTPTAAGQYAVQVWARPVGQSAFKNRSSGFFNITASTTPPTTLSLIGVAADPVPPAGTGEEVTFTGLATITGPGPVEFQFWLYTGATQTWAITRPWATSQTWTWTPPAAGTYAVQSWARLAGASTYQTKSTGFFTVASTPPDAPTVAITSFGSTPAAPFTSGAPVAWSTTASGSGTLQYAYWVYRQSTGVWTQARAYSSTSGYVWTPPAPGTYAVQVWVRRAGVELAYEAVGASGFFTVN